jgi:hypothetical protein
MTKINDLTIRMNAGTLPTRKLTRRMSQIGIPGGIRNPIDKLGFAGLSFSVSAYTTNEYDFDEMIAELLSDIVKLYIQDDWFYYVTVENIDSPIEETGVDYFPYKVSLKTEEPLRYSDAINEFSVSITTNNQTFGGTTITTDGNIYTKPDIILTGSSADSVILSQTEKW